MFTSKLTADRKGMPDIYLRGIDRKGFIYPIRFASGKNDVKLSHPRFKSPGTLKRYSAPWSWPASRIAIGVSPAHSLMHMMSMHEVAMEFCASFICDKQGIKIICACRGAKLGI